MITKILTKHEAKGSRQYMEDAAFIDYRGLNGVLLGVFDGHGGANVAGFCDENAGSVFAGFLLDGITNEDALFKTIAELSRRIDANPRLSSGTTVSLVYIPEHGNEVTVAVLGDSPVIVHTPSKGTWIAPEHNVRTNVTELNAAIARGGRAYGGYICNDEGDGLQMGRALGNPHLKGILNREPEVFSVDIEVGSWILVASDGLFDPSHKDDAPMKDLIALVTDFPKVTAYELVEAAIAAQTGDNVIAILARF